ncbi:MAG: N-acetylneuraminate synthase family protein [Planctomycetia bacterium]|nr:N-acetylneuraminate synthase family protein [Planctomycetia bacterium]
MTRPILIAECCQNHNGSYETLARMLDAAADAGADYVKIQSIRSSQLTHRPRFDTGETAPDGTVRVIKRPFEAERERLGKLDLTLEQEAKFVEACRRAGVKSMTTPFARATIPGIAQMGFDAIKVASYDCGSLPFIRDLVRRWDTIVVSTGASTDEEIAAASALLRESGKTAYLLHCVTIYPTPAHEMHLSRMNFLRLQLDRVGLSCHPRTSDLGIDPDKVALALGADCLERHYTVLPPGDTRDGPVSITPEHLRELRKFADLPVEERRERVRREVPGWPAYLGSASRTLSATELLNRDYYRGRFASPVAGGFVYNWEEAPVA